MRDLSCSAVPSGNTVLVDSSQEYKPFWWPPLLPPRVMWCAACLLQQPALRTPVCGPRCTLLRRPSLCYLGMRPWRLARVDNFLRRPCACAAVRHSALWHVASWSILSGYLGAIDMFALAVVIGFVGVVHEGLWALCMRGLHVLVLFCRTLLKSMCLHFGS